MTCSKKFWILIWTLISLLMLILMLNLDTPSNTSLNPVLIKYYHFVLLLKIKLNTSCVLV